MKPALQRLIWLLPLLICGLVLASGAALAVDVAGVVSPDQVKIAGEVGSEYARTLLVRLEPGVEIEGVVPGDLTSTDGTSVLPAESITASWPTPEPTDEDSGEVSEGADVAAEEAAEGEVATDAATKESAEAVPDTDVDKAAGSEIDPTEDAEPTIVYPVPMTVTVDLAGVDPGQYSGELFIVTSAGELPATLNVSVKAMGIWPLLVLMIGLGLGMWMSYYRKRGRRRDELLVEAGALRQSIDADPELAEDAVGSDFRQRMDNELLDAQVALRAVDWPVAGEKIGAARAVYVTWRKDRTNWIAQLKSAAAMRKRIEAIDEPFFRDLLAKLDASVAEAPTQSDAGPLRETLVLLARHEAEYRRADQLLVSMKGLINTLPSSPDQKKKFRDQYVDKPADYARQLSGLRPISAAEEYATQYKALVGNLETDIKAIRDKLDEWANARGMAEPSMSAAPAGDLSHAVDETVPPLEDPIDAKDADEARKRLRYFWFVSYLVALALLGAAGYNELYAAKPTFGATPWADYATLFAWGFGAEATRAAVTDMVRKWDIPFGSE